MCCEQCKMVEESAIDYIRTMTAARDDVASRAFLPGMSDEDLKAIEVEVADLDEHLDECMRDVDNLAERCQRC